jgi:hypothetical protein
MFESSSTAAGVVLHSFNIVCRRSLWVGAAPALLVQQQQQQQQHQRQQQQLLLALASSWM